MRIIVGLCFAIVLLAATPSESSAQVVSHEWTLNVTPEQIPALRTMLAEFRAVTERLGTRTAPGTHFIWHDLVTGAVDEIVLVIQYPSLEAWAAATAKQTADPAYRQARAKARAAGIGWVSENIKTAFTFPQ